MRKHCKRKHRPLLTDPVGFVVEGAAITSQAMLDKLRIRDLAAIEAFVKGQGGLQEWSDINAIQSIAETMALGGIGPEALPACQAAEKPYGTAPGSSRIVKPWSCGLTASRRFASFTNTTICNARRFLARNTSGGFKRRQTELGQRVKGL